ncbi:LOW QUALITY PROTEIN: 1-acylglycerol-3-phosphate O-acyltransferase, partial [Rhodococcus opacus PD630]
VYSTLAPESGVHRVVLDLQVRADRTGAADLRAAHDRRRAPHPGVGSGDPGEQSPHRRRLILPGPDGAQAHHVRGQERVLHRGRREGPRETLVLHRGRPGADRPVRGLRGGIRTEHREEDPGRRQLWGIYPEGTRSPDGRLHKGKTGIARVALATGAPVVPVAMHGTRQVNPVGSRMWRFGKVTVTVGEPLDFSRFAELRDNRHVVRAATDELMHALMTLSGQEYVDDYALERPA